MQGSRAPSEKCSVSPISTALFLPIDVFPPSAEPEAVWACYVVWFCLAPVLASLGSGTDAESLTLLDETPKTGVFC